MRRLFVPEENIQGEAIRIDDEKTIFHLLTVLRMVVGDHLYVSDGVSSAYEAEIDKASKSEILLKVVSKQPFEEEFGTRITLFQGLPKGAKMDEVVRKTSELGVCRIVPFISSRSVSALRGDAAVSKAERWRRIAEEAARQSQRISIPEVSDVISFSDALLSLDSGDFDLVLVLYELEEELTLKNVLTEHTYGFFQSGGGWYSRIAVFIGPEGGFEAEEVGRLTDAKAKAVTIGSTILRTENAAFAAISMIRYALDL